MALFVRVRSLLRNLFLARDVEADLDEEVRAHLEMLVDENVRAGMTLDEAQRAARIELGGIEQVKEQVRDERLGNWLGSVIADCRFGLRQLGKNPGFAAIAILTLALGIGATTAIFSVVYGVLLRPLPYPKPEQIVRLWEVAADGHHMNFADPNFADIRSQAHSLAGVAEYNANLESVSGGREPVRAMTAAVSKDFLPVMGIQPYLGRSFETEDQHVGATPVALVSYGYWKQYLNGAVELSAARLRTDNFSFSVIGVLPPGFRFPDGTDIWIPRELVPILPSRTAHNWQVVGRLRNGFTVSAARSEVSSIARQLRQRYGSDIHLVSAALEPMREAMTGSVRPALILLLLASGFLLLIACANVVNLMLAQATARERELAVRSALGAERGRLIRQLFTEALLLALIGCTLGVLVAAWGVRVLVKMAPSTLPRVEDVSVNTVVLLFSLGITIILAALLGLFSALRASSNARSALGEASQRQAGSARTDRLRRLLISGQLATTLALLAGAGLLGRSLLQVLSVDPGFRMEHVATMTVEMPAAFENPQKVPRAQFLSELLGRLRRIPGVTEVGVSTDMPLAAESPSDGTFAVLNPQQISPKTQDLIDRSATGSLDSQPEILKEMTVFFDEIFRDPSHTGAANYSVVSEGYFRALRIPLLDGRLFDERDGFNAPQVALISSSLARKRWPKGGALGQTIEFGNMDGDLRLLTVIGIVGDVRETSVESPPSATIYVNYRQRPQATRHFTVVLQTDADVPSVTRAAREDLHDLDPDIPPHFSTLSQIFSAALETRRFSLTLVGIFAATALFLATTGIYGVTSYSVSRRTREFGVRMALGASPGAVLRLVLKQGIGAIAIGVLVGVGGSLVLMQTMKALLFGVSPADPLTLIGVTLLLTLVSLVASYIPARQATDVDPMVALRYE